MSDQKDEKSTRRPHSTPGSPKVEPHQKKNQSGDPDNKSDTTGATESGEEDVGAKA